MHLPNPGDRVLDLHAHTTASDGDHTPTELVRHAGEIGLAAIAVTDHDTTDGIVEALEAGRAYGVEVVPGIELSAEVSLGQCHLLGYLVDPQASALTSRLQEVWDNRIRRNERIVEKMRSELGFDITLEEVEAVAGGDIVARPHFARVLVNKGYAGSIQGAFDDYLAKGAKAYVDRDRLLPEEAIALIHDAGGLAILAHPNNLKRNPAGTAAEIRRLQSLGLDGIEARYSRHTPEENARYLALAAELGLLTTGGSDFHGPTVKSKIFLGQVEHFEGQEVGQPAPYALLSALREARGQAARRS
jgi:predicted metal-dependent phosphoesterase TrpH